MKILNLFFFFYSKAIEETLKRIIEGREAKGKMEYMWMDL